MEEYLTTDENGDDLFIPGKRVLCPRCNGDGQVDHPAFSNGITQSEWAEWDEEERDLYLGGAYDVVCPRCSGRRWVVVPDEDQCTIEEMKAYRNEIERREYDAAVYRAERGIY